MTPRRSIRALCLAGLLTGLLGSVMPGAAEAATYFSVTRIAPGHVAWIHLKPDVASPRVGYLKAGTLRVRATGCGPLAKKGWCRVLHGGTRGWVQDRFLKPGTLMRS